MSPYEQIVFPLLSKALSLSDELPDCSHIGWPEFFRFAQQQSVAPLLASVILQLPPAQQPPRSILIPWLAEQDRARERYQKAQAAVGEIVDFLSSHGNPTLLFKGPTIAECYPDPSLRPFSDIDLYHFGHHKEADQLLHDHFGITIVNRAEPHTQYMFQGILFENHYSFLNLHSIPSNRPYERLLLTLLPSPSSLNLSSPLLTPSSTFTALYLMRHMAGHFAAGGITLRHLCDWRMFLERHADRVDWSLVESTFKEHHMTPFVDALTFLSQFPTSLSSRCDYSLNPHQSTLTTQIITSILTPLPPHPSETLSRLFWKIRRYHANRWKRRNTCRDSEIALLLHAITSHLHRPYTILHRV